MKIIFLDVDGVLNDNSGYHLDDFRLKLLKRIIKQTDAKIVVSSTWRLSKLSLLQKKLNKYDLKIYSQTDVLDKRENEIHSWLNKNSDLNISQWVSIDDMDMILDDVHFVQTYNGITEKDTCEIIKKLKYTKIKRENLEDIGLDENEYIYM
jgi:hypothetical protein